MSINNKHLIRVVSLILVLAFFAQDLLWAVPNISPKSTPIHKSIVAYPELLEVPYNHALAKEMYKGNSDKLIIHIQDAHSNYSGQDNLASTIEYLASKYKLSLILSEGGAGDCSLDWLRNLAPTNSWKRTAKNLLMEGKIQGEEYLNLTSELPIKIQGIEDMALYFESVQNYGYLADKRESILEYLQKIVHSIDKIKSKVYPQDIQQYEEQRPRQHGASEGLKGDLEGLLKLMKGRKISLAAYPNIEKLAMLREREKGVDFEMANVEFASLIEQISERDDREKLRDYLNKVSQLKNSKVSQLAYFQNTLNIAKEKQLDISRFPNFLLYIEYLKDFGQVNLDEVLNEMLKAEDALYRGALESNYNGRLIRSIDRYLGLLETAYRIQMTTNEFRLFDVNEADFATERYLAFINTQLSEYGFFEDLIPYRPILEEGKSALRQFYESVSQRDLAFIKNSKKALADQNQKIAILISGGYHTANLKALLKKEGYSYVVLSPIINSSTNQSRYENRLLGSIRKEKQIVKTGGEISQVRKSTLSDIERYIKAAKKRKEEGVRSTLLALGLDLGTLPADPAARSAMLTGYLRSVEECLSMLDDITVEGTNDGEIGKTRQRLQALRDELKRIEEAGPVSDTGATKAEPAAPQEEMPEVVMPTSGTRLAKHNWKLPLDIVTDYELKIAGYSFEFSQGLEGVLRIKRIGSALTDGAEIELGKAYEVRRKSDTSLTLTEVQLDTVGNIKERVRDVYVSADAQGAGTANILTTGHAIIFIKDQSLIVQAKPESRPYVKMLRKKREPDQTSSGLVNQLLRLLAQERLTSQQTGQIPFRYLSMGIYFDATGKPIEPTRRVILPNRGSHASAHWCDMQFQQYAFGGSGLAIGRWEMNRSSGQLPEALTQALRIYREELVFVEGDAVTPSTYNHALGYYIPLRDVEILQKDDYTRWLGDRTQIPVFNTLSELDRQVRVNMNREALEERLAKGDYVVARVNGVVQAVKKYWGDHGDIEASAITPGTLLELRSGARLAAWTERSDVETPWLDKWIEEHSDLIREARLQMSLPSDRFIRGSYGLKEFRGELVNAMGDEDGIDLYYTDGRWLRYIRQQVEYFKQVLLPERRSPNKIAGSLIRKSFQIAIGLIGYFQPSALPIYNQDGVLAKIYIASDYSLKTALFGMLPGCFVLSIFQAPLWILFFPVIMAGVLTLRYSREADLHELLHAYQYLMIHRLFSTRKVEMMSEAEIRNIMYVFLEMKNHEALMDSGKEISSANLRRFENQIIARALLAEEYIRREYEAQESLGARLAARSSSASGRFTEKRKLDPNVKEYLGGANWAQYYSWVENQMNLVLAAKDDPAELERLAKNWTRAERWGSVRKQLISHFGDNPFVSRDQINGAIKLLRTELSLIGPLDYVYGFGRTVDGRIQHYTGVAVFQKVYADLLNIAKFRLLGRVSSPNEAYMESLKQKKAQGARLAIDWNKSDQAIAYLLSIRDGDIDAWNAAINELKNASTALEGIMEPEKDLVVRAGELLEQYCRRSDLVRYRSSSGEVTLNRPYLIMISYLLWMACGKKTPAYKIYQSLRDPFVKEAIGKEDIQRLKVAFDLNGRDQVADVEAEIVTDRDFSLSGPLLGHASTFGIFADQFRFLKLFQGLWGENLGWRPAVGFMAYWQIGSKLLTIHAGPGAFWKKTFQNAIALRSRDSLYLLALDDKGFAIQLNRLGHNGYEMPVDLEALPLELQEVYFDIQNRSGARLASDDRQMNIRQAAQSIRNLFPSDIQFASITEKIEAWLSGRVGEDQGVLRFTISTDSRPADPGVAQVITILKQNQVLDLIREVFALANTLEANQEEVKIASHRADYYLEQKQWVAAWSQYKLAESLGYEGAKDMALAVEKEWLQDLEAEGILGKEKNGALVRGELVSGIGRGDALKYFEVSTGGEALENIGKGYAHAVIYHGDYFVILTYDREGAINGIQREWTDEYFIFARPLYKHLHSIEVVVEGGDLFVIGKSHGVEIERFKMILKDGALNTHTEIDPIERMKRIEGLPLSPLEQKVVREVVDLVQTKKMTTHAIDEVIKYYEELYISYLEMRYLTNRDERQEAIERNSRAEIGLSQEAVTAKKEIAALMSDEYHMTRNQNKPEAYRYLRIIKEVRQRMAAMVSGSRLSIETAVDILKDPQNPLLRPQWLGPLRRAIEHEYNNGRPLQEYVVVEDAVLSQTRQRRTPGASKAIKDLLSRGPIVQIGANQYVYLSVIQPERLGEDLRSTTFKVMVVRKPRIGQYAFKKVSSRDIFEGMGDCLFYLEMNVSVRGSRPVIQLTQLGRYRHLPRGSIEKIFPRAAAFLRKEFPGALIRARLASRTALRILDMNFVNVRPLRRSQAVETPSWENPITYTAKVPLDGARLAQQDKVEALLGLLRAHRLTAYDAANEILRVHGLDTNIRRLANTDRRAHHLEILLDRVQRSGHFEADTLRRIGKLAEGIGSAFRAEAAISPKVETPQRTEIPKEWLERTRRLADFLSSLSVVTEQYDVMALGAYIHLRPKSGRGPKQHIFFVESSLDIGRLINFLDIKKQAARINRILHPRVSGSRLGKRLPGIAKQVMDGLSRVWFAIPRPVRLTVSAFTIVGLVILISNWFSRQDVPLAPSAHAPPQSQSAMTNAATPRLATPPTVVTNNAHVPIPYEGLERAYQFLTATENNYNIYGAPVFSDLSSTPQQNEEIKRNIIAMAFNIGLYESGLSNRVQVGATWPALGELQIEPETMGTILNWAFRKAETNVIRNVLLRDIAPGSAEHQNYRNIADRVRRDQNGQVRNNPATNRLIQNLYATEPAFRWKMVFLKLRFESESIGSDLRSPRGLFIPNRTSLDAQRLFYRMGWRPGQAYDGDIELSFFMGNAMLGWIPERDARTGVFHFTYFWAGSFSEYIDRHREYIHRMNIQNEPLRNAWNSLHERLQSGKNRVRDGVERTPERNLQDWVLLYRAMENALDLQRDIGEMRYGNYFMPLYPGTNHTYYTHFLQRSSKEIDSVWNARFMVGVYSNIISADRMITNYRRGQPLAPIQQRIAMSKALLRRVQNNPSDRGNNRPYPESWNRFLGLHLNDATNQIANVEAKLRKISAQPPSRRERYTPPRQTQERRPTAPPTRNRPTGRRGARLAEVEQLQQMQAALPGGVLQEIASITKARVENVLGGTQTARLSRPQLISDRLASGEDYRFQLVFGAELYKENMHPADVQNLDAHSLQILAEAFVSSPESVAELPLPMQFQGKIGAITMTSEGDGAVIQFYAIEDGQTAEIGTITLSKDALDAARRSARDRRSRIAGPVVTEKETEALAAFAEGERLVRLAARAWSQGGPVLVKLAVSERMHQDQNLMTSLRGQVEQARQLIRSRGENQVYVQIISQDGQAVLTGSDNIRALTGVEHKTMFIGPSDRSIIQQAESLSAGYLPTAGITEKTGKYQVIPYTAAIIAAVLVGRNETPSDKLDVVLRNLIGQDYYRVGTDIQSNYQALRTASTRYLDLGLYVKLTIKAIAPLDINKFMEYTQLILKAVGSAA